MRTNRKGSRTFVVLACKGHYAPGGRSVRLQIFQRDRISGRNGIWAGGDASTIVRVTLISNWNEIASYKPQLCTRGAAALGCGKPVLSSDAGRVGLSPLGVSKRHTACTHPANR